MTHDLSARFERLRIEDAARAPRFATTLQSARARRRQRFVVKPARALTIALVIGGALTAGIFFGRGRDELTSTLLSVARWEAPSDFLLHTPGAEFLSSLPAIVAPEALSPVTPAEEWRDP